MEFGRPARPAAAPGQTARRPRLREEIPSVDLRRDRHLPGRYGRSGEAGFHAGVFDRTGRGASPAGAGAVCADPNVTILQGDSGEVLRGLLPRIDRPALFWLDGHFSDADTARSALITPIRTELDHILAHPLARRHVILIDDARLFNGEDDYPTLESLNAVLARAGFPACRVQDDIIRIHR